MGLRSDAVAYKTPDLSPKAPFLKNKYAFVYIYCAHFFLKVFFLLRLYYHDDLNSKSSSSSGYITR